MDARLNGKQRRDVRRQSIPKGEHLSHPSGPSRPAGGLLPREQPLAMPQQDFARLPMQDLPSMPDAAARWRRLSVFAGAGLLTATFAWKLHEVLSVGRLTPLQAIFLALCTLAFGWIALGGVSAVAGFMTLMRGRPAGLIALPEGRIALNERTALLFPIHHEDPRDVASAIDAMAEDLGRLGASGAFAVFVLSDSRTPDAEARELAAFGALARRYGGQLPIYYRRRPVNEGRKAGNIADWVRRFGAGYAHCIVLDADSVMSARLLSQLAAAMQSTPRAGLIQTVPRIVGGSTLMARLQQFATATYGPVIAAGSAWWHRTHGNYWGHNAILRTAAFASAAGLPTLPGRAPFGGHIQSHDFIEAALLVRAGWEVHLVPQAEGSYEGAPPTLIDVALRDRRWAQGNLQHIPLVSAKGLRPLSRLHLIMGIFAYLSSVLWMAMLAVGVVLALQSKHYLPSYFTDRGTLFPIWPEMDSAAALTLFFATVVVVLLPKALGITYVLAIAARRRAHGGAARVLSGALIESVCSTLLAPIQMVTQAQAVIEILMGRDSGWQAQRRDGVATTLADAWRFHHWHVALGAVTAALCFWVSGPVLAWMAPIVLGLLLAVAISWLTAQEAPAPLARLLATKEEIAEPRILTLVARARTNWAARSLSLDDKPGSAALMGASNSELLRRARAV